MGARSYMSDRRERPPWLARASRWLSSLLRSPAVAITALTAACLAAFLLTVPLPRVDGELIGSDGIRYYVYLPSLLIDGDLDFTDEYRHFYRRFPETADHLVKDRTATGLPANRFGVGPAILWSPFFLTAHLLAVSANALGLDAGADGTGGFYQVVVLAGSIFYGGGGLWLCFLAARRMSSERAALAATGWTVLAGNLIYYMTVEPSMSHPLSMFAASAFFCLWLVTRERRGWRSRLALGALAGLMALIRPQDGLFLALPIADETLTAWRNGRIAGLVRWLPTGLAMAGAAFFVFLPQLVVWKLLSGGFFRSGYSEEFAVLFHSPLPRLLDVLFSAQRGLFVWHPVFLLAIAGLLFWRDRRLAALAFAGFVIQWVVVSSWHDWAQGDAFGGRMFIVCTPILAIGLAALLDVAARRWPWRRILVCGAALVLLNFLLLVQYRVQLLGLGRPITWIDVTLGRFLLLG